MKTLILMLILLPATSGANSNYYNQYGTYEGSTVKNGPYTNYYNYRGDYMGSRVETTPEPAPAYDPPIHLSPIPIPGTYNSILPDTGLMGDPE